MGDGEDGRAEKVGLGEEGRKERRWRELSFRFVLRLGLTVFYEILRINGVG